MSAIAVATDVVIRNVPVGDIEVGTNVRVDPGELEGLAASIRELGVLQPVKVVEHADGRYRLVWGQRRLLASRMAERETIPAIIVDAGDVDAPGSKRAIEQLVENLDRRDLNPIEEAHALREVLDADPKLTQAALAERLGRSSSWLANSLRLLGLDDEVQVKVRAGEISASHGKAIAALPAKQQRELATRIVRDKVSSNMIEQELKWKAAEAEQEAAKAKRSEKWIPKAIAALTAGQYDPLVDIFVGGSAYNVDIDAVVKGIKAGGWKNAVNKYSYSDLPPGCDCTSAIKLEVGGRSAAIARVCVNEAHRDRAANDRRQADAAARKEHERQVHQLGRALEAALRANPPHVAVLRLLSFTVGRSGGGWTAWEQHAALDLDGLIAEVVRTYANDWRLRDVDVGGLIAELSPTPIADAQAASAERVAAKRATRRAAMDGIVAEGKSIGGAEATAILDAAEAAVDAPVCICGKPKVAAGDDRWVCTNPDHDPKAVPG